MPTHTYIEMHLKNTAHGVAPPCTARIGAPVTWPQQAVGHGATAPGRARCLPAQGCRTPEYIFWKIITTISNDGGMQQWWYERMLLIMRTKSLRKTYFLGFTDISIKSAYFPFISAKKSFSTYLTLIITNIVFIINRNIYSTYWWYCLIFCK